MVNVGSLLCPPLLPWWSEDIRTLWGSTMDHYSVQHCSFGGLLVSSLTEGHSGQ